MEHQIIAFLLALVSVFIKGFQHKNVIGGHHRLIFVTSYVMAMTDILMIGIIVDRGWSICFATGSGAAIGMSLSVWIHDKMLHHKPSTIQPNGD